MLRIGKILGVFKLLSFIEIVATPYHSSEKGMLK